MDMCMRGNRESASIPNENGVTKPSDAKLDILALY
jgi:hypothetical protein